MANTTSNHINKFDKIYTFTNYAYWLNIYSIIGSIVVLIIVHILIALGKIPSYDTWFGAETKRNLLTFLITKFQNIEPWVFFLGYVLFVGGVLFVILHFLKKLALFGKNGNIFNAESRILVKNLCITFAFFSVVNIRIILLPILIFIWILYESFFIGFDYKKEKDKLEEENHLTI